MENENKIRTCELCGRVIEDDETTHDVDGHLVCDYCYENTDYGICADCGGIFYTDDLTITANGDAVCEDCRDSDYFFCEECGEYHPFCDEIVVNEGTGRDLSVCEGCVISGDFYQCNECEGYFTSGFIRTDDFGTAVCDRCYDYDDYAYCEECGRLERDMNFNEDVDGYLCATCENEYAGRHSYGYKPEPCFTHNGVNDTTNLYFGVELEVDDGDSVRQLCEDIDALGYNVYMKQDGSLSCRGVEIVTHPATLAYHNASSMWREITDVCRSHHYQGEDADCSCGMHIHASQAGIGDYETQLRLLLLVNAIWDKIVELSDRDEGDLIRWARKPDLPDVWIDETLNNESRLLRLAQDATHSGRYTALNFENDNTLELRVFNSTLDPDIIQLRIQLFARLIAFAQTHTAKECATARFEDIP